jgi:dihydrofolate reductase
MSLDGYFEGPNHELDWFVTDEEFFDYARNMLNSVDTILFGRLTYEMMAGYWPSAPPDEIAEKMNSLPKIIFSSTLSKLEWNNSRLINGNAVEEVYRLKQQQGGDMVVLGSATLASSLLQADLIDEYRVIVNPVLVGSGNSLFRGIKEMVKLKLLGVRPFASGVVMLSYRKC